MNGTVREMLKGNRIMRQVKAKHRQDGRVVLVEKGVKASAN